MLFPWRLREFERESVVFEHAKRVVDRRFLLLERWYRCFSSENVELLCRNIVEISCILAQTEIFTGACERKILVVSEFPPT